MKKLESTWYNMACVLTGISLVAGVALASVNKMTKDTIQELNDKREQAAIAQVLGGGDVKVQKVDTVVVSDNNYIVMNAGQKGVAVKAVDPQNASFGGGLTIMVGISPAGEVLGYNVLETHETPGLGAKAALWFQKGEKGDIIGRNLTEKELVVSKDGGDVDAITASTITSRAFLRAVNAAYQAYSQTQQDAPETDGVSGATQQQHN
ncbi:MAG: RnfABCDGE type electron transport complex subunit G [Bacteroidaceae bacterium]|nr:RnfABCDGE type electron transport complex subunit G [Bacteroidaceae bacterium]